MVLSPDSRKLYFTDTVRGEIGVVDLTEEQPKKTILYRRTSPSQISITPQG